jgi:hypothetical protein
MGGQWHQPAEGYTFFYGKGNKNPQIRQRSFFFLHKRIISAVKMVEFVSHRMSYTIRRMLVSCLFSESSCPKG